MPCTMMRALAGAPGAEMVSRSLDGAATDSAQVGQDTLTGIGQVVGTTFADSLAGSAAARERVRSKA